MKSSSIRIASVTIALALSVIVSGCTFGLADDTDASDPPVISGGPAVSAAPEPTEPDPSTEPSPSDAEPVSMSGTCDATPIIITVPDSTYLMTGSCGDVQILADDVMFQSDSALSITIVANGATVIVDQLDVLHVTGDENQVQWSSGADASSAEVDGNGNTILGP